MMIEGEIVTRPFGLIAAVPKDFANITHRKMPSGTMKFTIEPGGAYWTYKEDVGKDQISFITSSKNFEVRLTPNQIDFLRYLQTLVYDQLGNILLEREQTDIESIWQKTKFILDISEYARIKQRDKKDVRKETLAVIDTLKDRVFHYRVKYFDKKTKKHAFFMLDAPIFEIAQEEDKRGNIKKNGLILLGLTFNFVNYIVQTAHFNFIPYTFWRISGRNQTAKYLADACLDRYHQSHKKDGKSFWLLETALKEAGLRSEFTRAAKNANAEEIQASGRRSIQEDFRLFLNAVNYLKEEKFLDKEQTFFSTDQKGENRLAPDDVNPEERLYFHFMILDIKKPPSKSTKTKTKPKKEPKKPWGGIKPGIDPDAQ